MAEAMTFPETIKEFLEQYKITDTEHVYTNGTDLIPIFRVLQWYEHHITPAADVVAVVRCKDCMNWNTRTGYCSMLMMNILDEDFYCAEGETDGPEK